MLKSECKPLTSQLKQKRNLCTENTMLTTLSLSFKALIHLNIPIPSLQKLYLSKNLLRKINSVLSHWDSWVGQMFALLWMPFRFKLCSHYMVEASIISFLSVLPSVSRSASSPGYNKMKIKVTKTNPAFCPNVTIWNFKYTYG